MTSCLDRRVKAWQRALIGGLVAAMGLVGCGAEEEVQEVPVTWHEGHGPAADLCITTQYTPNIAAYAKVAVRNHVAYAQEHGYTQVVYRGRPGPEFIDPEAGGLHTSHGGGLYWQKLAAMRQTLAATHEDGTPKCRWAMWVDADIVFTNFKTRLETLIETFGDDATTEMILTREQAGFKRVQLNSGAFFVKNTPGGRAFIDDVSSTFHKYRNAGFPDQDAITDYVANHDMHRHGPLATFRTAKLRDNVSLAPQRAFNAFGGRYDHFIANAQWRPCDFVAHFTGATTPDRVARMTQAAANARACAQPAPLYQELLHD